VVGNGNGNATVHSAECVWLATVPFVSRRQKSSHGSDKPLAVVELYTRILHSHPTFKLSVVDDVIPCPVFLSRVQLLIGVANPNADPQTSPTELTF